jgi:hypothetical protein
LDKGILKKFQIPVNEKLFNDLEKHFTITDFKNTKTKRELYNKYSDLKFSEQLGAELKYTQGLGKIADAFLAGSFYDDQFIKFAASIPFESAIKAVKGFNPLQNKKVLIRKYILREALKNKLNDSIYYRGKAVSPSNYLFFEGNLGDTVDNIVQKDLASDNSFIKKFGLQDFINKYKNTQNWQEIEDESFLVKIYNTATLITYHHRLQKLATQKQATNDARS